MVLCFSKSIAQHQELNEDPKLWGKSKKVIDSNNLLFQFQMGTMHGHFRSFYSATYNKNSNVEYANAVGGGIQFISKPLYHINIGVSGFFIYDAFSSDLSVPHPLSNTLNRYELGLFDLTNPKNKTNIDRLEELYLQYNKKNYKITIGKQLLNTPFINLQDGRMRPTEVQGFWGQHNFNNSKWYAGWINRFSPRSTVEWFNTSESIGVYSVGINQDGSKSGYKNNLESSGVALAGTEISLNKNYKIQIWNQYVDKIFNTSLIQLDKIPNDYQKKYFGIQIIRQSVIGNGGNEALNKTYFNPSQKSLVISARLGQQIGQWDHSINYTRITKSGRYLMPREWGRDPFYTFIAGERNEGYGDLTAYVLKTKYLSNQIPLTINGALGYFILPDIKNFALNKYSFPSFWQYNIDTRYALRGFWKGWEIQVIYFYKKASGNTYKDPKNYINKVDMGHFNFVLNFHF